MEPATDRGWHTRQRLLDAAERVFGEQDFFRASVSAIVREAGVGQGTFYLYFASKLDIFRALVRWLGHSLRSTIAQGVAAERGRLDVELAGFRTFFTFIEQHRHAYRIVKQAEAVEPAVYREYYELLAQGYREGLAAAIERGEIAPYHDPEAIAYMLMGIGDFLGMRYLLWADGPVPATVQADLDRFLRAALRDGLITAGGEAAPARGSSGSDS